jgi:hypothetical protein
MGWNKGGYRGFDEGWNISTTANPVVTYIGAGSSGSRNIGTAASNRRVILMGSLASSGRTVTSVTIDGNATDLTQTGSGNDSTGGNLTWVASAVVPTGTTATIAVNYSSTNFLAAPIAIWTVNNDFLLSSTPTAAGDHPTSATSASANLTTAFGGFTLMSALSFGAATTWTVTSSDDPITEVGRDNGNGRLWGYSNGTQARTANTALSSSATTNLHLSLWNFR